jgi:hypothetical protein
VVLVDAGVENANAQVDALITTGVLRWVLAFTELKFSNSNASSPSVDAPVVRAVDDADTATSGKWAPTTAQFSPHGVVLALLAEMGFSQEPQFRTSMHSVLSFVKSPPCLVMTAHPSAPEAGCLMTSNSGRLERQGAEPRLRGRLDAMRR